MTMPTHAYALARHKLKLRDAVEVELLVTAADDGQPRPRTIEGTVTDATEAVLVLDNRYGRAVRIPWAAVALIRDAHSDHPAL